MKQSIIKTRKELIKNQILMLLCLCAFICASFATKVVILNDLHLDPYFDPAVTVQEDCRGPNPFKLLNIANSDLAPYGRYGCDTPPSLITMFMKKVRELSGDPDVILVSGDFATHDVAAKRGQAEPHYDILKSIITQDFNQYIGPMF